MALNIPMPDLPGTGFLKGIDTGSSMFTRMIQPVLEREKQRQQAEQFAQELELRKQQLAKQGANSDLQRALLQQQILAAKHANDPMYEFNQFKNLMGAMSGGATPTGGAGGGQLPMPTQEMGQGMGMFSPQGLNDAQQAAPPAQPADDSQLFEALKSNPMLRGFFKKKFGFDPLAPAPETPEQKRALDLQSQIALENIKTGNKTKALEQKELVAVKKDLPTLEKSLKGVDELLNIAKNNPDMFGHGFMPDRFAKTTKNKNFGKWQNLISDAIAGLEQKLSARGNIVALKMAAQLKPSHAEQQNVAIGKLESMRQQLVDSINNSRGKLGQDKVPQEEANMDLSQMSDEELQRIASGGQ